MAAEHVPTGNRLAYEAIDGQVFLGVFHDDKVIALARLSTDAARKLSIKLWETASEAEAEFDAELQKILEEGA